MTQGNTLFVRDDWVTVRVEGSQNLCPKGSQYTTSEHENWPCQGRSDWDCTRTNLYVTCHDMSRHCKRNTKATHGCHDTASMLVFTHTRLRTRNTSMHPYIQEQCELRGWPMQTAGVHVEEGLVSNRLQGLGGGVEVGEVNEGLKQASRTLGVSPTMMLCHTVASRPMPTS